MLWKLQNRFVTNLFRPKVRFIRWKLKLPFSIKVCFDQKSPNQKAIGIFRVMKVS